jgi:AcrR family transcriptional regulator
VSKKEIILKAAEELFAEHGYEGTSVRKLAKYANVNIAMISYYFGSKEKLFEELVEFRASVLREKLRGVNENVEDPSQRIECVVSLIVDRIFTNPLFHKMVHREISLQQRSGMNDRIVNILLKNIEQVKKMIQDGIKKKVFRNADVELVICSLFSTTSQVAQSSAFSEKLLGLKIGISEKQNEQIRMRLKNYLCDLLKHYLLIEQEKN